MTMKAAASLTSSLLARKGAAYPAAYSAPTTASPDDSSDSAAPESSSRAYNDPRVIASAPPSAVEPPVVDSPLVAKSSMAAPSPVEPSADSDPQMQDGGFVEDIETPDQTPDSEPETEAGEQPVEEPGLPRTMDKMGRVRLSVRLDPDRYLRVKMASARSRWSAQDIVIAALDKFLDGQAENKVANSGNGAAHQQGDEDSG